MIPPTPAFVVTLNFSILILKEASITWSFEIFGIDNVLIFPLLTLSSLTSSISYPSFGLMLNAGLDPFS